jgi:hypothetical protein
MASRLGTIASIASIAWGPLHCFHHLEKVVVHSSCYTKSDDVQVDLAHLRVLVFEALN